MIKFFVTLKMTDVTCGTPREEYLYVLEVFVDQVKLYAEKTEKLDPTTLGVDLKFIDFPVFRIFQADFEVTKKDKAKESSRDAKYRTVNFSAGRTCLFPIDPAYLVRSMKSSPILLDVYKIKDIEKCPYQVIKDPLGNAKIPLAGCCCDQAAMAGNDRNRLPAPYVLKNTYGLTDEDHKPSGLVSIFLRLTCFGKYVNMEYAILDKTLLFKNDGSSNEFRCTKLRLPDEDDRRAIEMETKKCLPDKEFGDSELDMPPLPQNACGLVLVCKELVERDEYPPEIPLRKKEVPRVIELGPVEEVVRESKKSEEEESDLSCVCWPDGTYLRSYVKATPCGTINCSGGLCIGKRMLSVPARNHQGETSKIPCFTGSCCTGRTLTGSPCSLYSHK